MTPITFLIDFSDDNCDKNLIDFARFYYSNVPNNNFNNNQMEKYIKKKTYSDFKNVRLKIIKKTPIF